MFFSFLLKILGADKEEEKTQRIISVLALRRSGSGGDEVRSEYMELRKTF